MTVLTVLKELLPLARDIVAWATKGDRPEPPALAYLPSMSESRKAELRTRAKAARELRAPK